MTSAPRARNAPRALGVLLALAVAGCASPAARTGDAAQGAPVWALDCALAESAPEGWSQACARPVSASPGSKTETWVAANPRDPANVVVAYKDTDSTLSAACSWNAHDVTLDGGATWTHVVIGGEYLDRRPGEPWFGYACATDPMLAYDADGRLHAVMNLYALGAAAGGAAGATARMVLATSDDGGLTWPTAIVLVEGDGVTSAPDYPRLIVNPASGSVHASFANFGANPAGLGRCTIVTSRDGGASAETPVVVRTGATPGCTALAASPDGTILAASQNGTWFARSADDGASFTAFEEAREPVSPVPIHVGNLAFDLSEGPLRGRVYLDYVSYETGDADVLVAWSDDDGATWSAPVVVGGEVAGTAQGHLRNPSGVIPHVGHALAVDEDGSVHLFYLDEQWAPSSSGSHFADVVHAVSTDGGAQWAISRVSTRSFDVERGRSQAGTAHYGDYHGLAVSEGVAWMAWPDASGPGGPGDTVVALARSFRR